MKEDGTTDRGACTRRRDPDPGGVDRQQLRAILAERITDVLDNRKLTVRAAQEETGIAAADFSRIRNARLKRFTIDRLLAILEGLGQEVEVRVSVQPRRSPRTAVAPHG